MPTLCQICRGRFDDSPDMLILCGHKKGAVHLGCCMHNCSHDRRPCKHSVAIYDKVNTKV